MQTTHSVHRKIIECIAREWPNGQPFAAHEVRDAAGVSAASAARVLTQLVTLRMLVKTHRGFAHRFYRVSVHWPRETAKAIENYELAKVLGL